MDREVLQSSFFALLFAIGHHRHGWARPSGEQAIEDRGRCRQAFPVRTGSVSRGEDPVPAAALGREHVTVDSGEFLVAGKATGDAIFDRLREHLNLRDGGVRQDRRTFLDTFDWRLSRGGQVIELVGNGKAQRLVWRRGEKVAPRASLAIARHPRFIDDIPEGIVRDALAPVVEMRALMPVARLKSRVHTALGLDRNQKTVVRIEVEENIAQSPDGGRTVPLRPRLRVLSVAGYKGAFSRAVQAIRASLDVVPAKVDLKSAALMALGIPFGSDPNKVGVRLDPTMASGDAMRRILLPLVDVMEINHSGVVDNVDSEFLHEFRIAVRRSRTAFFNLSDSYEGIGGFLDELTWLGRATGPTRDLDVYILNFSQFEERLSSHLRPDLAPLKRFLCDQRSKEFRQLKRDLRSRRYREFVKRWRAFLETPHPECRELPQAQIPIADCTSPWIWAMYRTLMKQGLAIRIDTDAKVLHSLRKACKMLRYNLDFFRTLYPERKMGAVLKELKLLQETLGTFQDREVQILTLREYARLMMEKGGYGSNTFLAMGVLIDGLAQSQRRVREESAERFGRFARRRTRERFQALFSPGSVSGGSSDMDADQPENPHEGLGGLQYQGRRRQDGVGGQSGLSRGRRGDAGAGVGSRSPGRGQLLFPH